MKDITDYQDKKILVLGLAKSGVSAARLLQKLGALVTVNDAKPFDENPDAQELLEDGIKVVTGGHPLTLLDEGFELIVKNPGIPYTNPIIKGALSKKIPIISEPELAYQVLSGEMIGITGSNGKTTTTTMIQLMLDEKRPAGHAYLAGNIGIPATTVVQKIQSQDTMVTELSSFMLASVTTLKPHIAVITNIFSNHLDWHGTRENYVRDKMHITKNQTEKDYLVINWDNPEWQHLSKQTKAQVVPFSRQDLTEDGAYQKGEDLYFKGEKIIAASDIKVPGVQNVENALAAIAVAKIEGQSNESIVHVLESFGGVKHRVQYVTTWNDRDFYNDSKATDIEATQVALRSFTKPIVLIAGGLDRGYTFEKLEADFKAHVKAIILVGQTSSLLAETAKNAGVPVIEFAHKVLDAVPLAYKASDTGDVVLLSPANASWDQYKTFEVRGDEFINAVQTLQNGKKA
ncbi:MULTISPECIES: UDP-N-acetylmuramoyl-L-alanine--D-glutamate ligase [Pediococcus]|uniref:UDP-N-acetylmuramoyl-L-alanine--D-glutamate ligase n=1 Tax=Pediococcus TaxID=1253 RepID=UPI000E904148|nr:MULTISPECIES: UDP-N-acetylmuramoyl-L-alanine--D-glutamate ligase [Pediococcus]MCT3028672.1 UDP-N-acetylmuramoyl-L-alanine--D-glutamate ligase [Pediococcus parvulus]MCT3031283.1 UDP-N-acetylmuramoyl-L-alanine--D-glutamate ligase [Pediococcus parvulus]HBO47816.1 UDP-N-acetylmuramoyl-L-alanine--D-glutamate ligase [Pediococcus sp.]